LAGADYSVESAVSAVPWEVGIGKRDKFRLLDSGWECIGSSEICEVSFTRSVCAYSSSLSKCCDPCRASTLEQQPRSKLNPVCEPQGGVPSTRVIMPGGRVVGGGLVRL
jgi:hypothetical protein